MKLFVLRRLNLSSYLKAPGDGRLRPQIPAKAFLWAQLIGWIFRECSFHAVEALVQLSAKALGVCRCFGDDALAYFSERLDPAPTRAALVAILKQAKRNNAFDDSRFIGLALDGTGAARCREKGCDLCHPVSNAEHVQTGNHHYFSVISIVGTGLSLPFDVEPYGEGDSEYGASQRLLRRAVEALGPRFADYVVGDGEYATAPFLHAAGDLGLHVLARLKGNLPQLFNAAKGRFSVLPPSGSVEVDDDRVEFWDHDDFDPWETLRWPSVRVLRYRQHKRDGSVVEAYWLTDWPTKKVGALALYKMAKSRWEIENQGFNDAKNRYGLEHVGHHHRNSLLIRWLLGLLAIVIERLYRLRYLKRGTHRPHTPIEFLRLLRLALAATSKAHNSS